MASQAMVTELPGSVQPVPSKNLDEKEIASLHTGSGTSGVAPSDQIRRIGFGLNGNLREQTEQMKKRLETQSLPNGRWLMPKKLIHPCSDFPLDPR